MSGVGSSPTLAKCETSQILLAGVPGGFSRGSPIFAPPMIDPSHMSCNNLERDVKLNQKKKKSLMLVFLTPGHVTMFHIKMHTGVMLTFL